MNHSCHLLREQDHLASPIKKFLLNILSHTIHGKIIKVIWIKTLRKMQRLKERQHLKTKDYTFEAAFFIFYVMWVLLYNGFMHTLNRLKRALCWSFHVVQIQGNTNWPAWLSSVLEQMAAIPTCSKTLRHLAAGAPDKMIAVDSRRFPTGMPLTSGWLDQRRTLSHELHFMSTRICKYTIHRSQIL